MSNEEQEAAATGTATATAVPPTPTAQERAELTSLVTAVQNEPGMVGYFVRRVDSQLYWAARDALPRLLAALLGVESERDALVERIANQAVVIQRLRERYDVTAMKNEQLAEQRDGARDECNVLRQQLATERTLTDEAMRLATVADEECDRLRAENALLEAEVKRRLDVEAQEQEALRDVMALDTNWAYDDDDECAATATVAATGTPPTPTTTATGGETTTTETGEAAPKRKVSEWLAQRDFQILDPDGFRDLGIWEWESYECTEQEFIWRAALCTQAPKGWE